MFIIPPTPAVRDSNLGIETLDSVFSVLACCVRIELRVPAALRAELPSPIVSGAEFDDRGPADAVLSVRVNHSAEGAPLYEITESSMVLGTESNLQAAASIVESWAQLTVATLADGLVFVHAGVVGWRSRGIVMPGRSLSGKSTLVLALVEAGADYYSDECTIFDSEGRVHPYWRLPNLRGAAGKKAARELLGHVLSGSPPSPIPLGWVLISRYGAESSWQPRRLSCGETLLRLLDNTVPLRRRPEQSVKTLARAAANARGFEGVRGEAANFAQQALGLL
jgi:hypothetical protein